MNIDGQKQNSVMSNISLNRSIKIVFNKLKKYTLDFIYVRKHLIGLFPFTQRWQCLIHNGTLKIFELYELHRYQ